jgi:ankyrin repeat protein/predicted Ser/Thr protein kinase
MNCPSCHKAGQAAGQKCEGCGLVIPTAEALDEGRRQRTRELWDEMAFPSVLFLAPGAVFAGRYEVVRELGRGGMGIVYLVQDKELDGEECALKVLLPELTANPEVERLFKREVLSSRKLTHRNIIKTFHYGKEQGLSYFTMEYLHGRSLRELLEEKKNKGDTFELDEACGVLLPVLDALGEAHARDVVHRDLSPENIMIAGEFPEAEVKVLDFGLARIMTSSQFTKTAHAMGKVGYASPEQIHEPKNVDARSDIYSTGVVLYELLTGEIPMGRFDLPSELVDGLPIGVDDIVGKTLKPNINLRYDNILKLASALNIVLEEWLKYIVPVWVKKIELALKSKKDTHALKYLERIFKSKGQFIPEAKTTINKIGDALGKTDDILGKMPLRSAVYKGYVRAAKFLIDHGADVKKENNGWTPLHLAASKGHENVAKLLIDHGADVKKKNDGLTPLHRAAFKGHTDIVRLLIDHGADVSEKTDDGWTPLHWAAVKGHTDVTKLLIDHGTDVNTKVEKGNTPLHLAASKGHEDVTKLLIDHGADVNAKALLGWTPLHDAASNGHVGVVKRLFEQGGDVSAKTKMGSTPLSLATQEDHVDVVTLLIEHGADVTEKEKDGWTPLHLAAFRGRVDIAKLLIDHGADVSAKEEKGNTPLHLTAEWDQADMVRLLIEHGANVTEQTDDGWTPLHMAAQEGHAKVAKLLIDHSADVHAKNARLTIPEDSPLRIKDYCCGLEIKNVLPLHLAAQEGHVNTAKLLIENGADVCAEGEDGWQPLHVATLEGHADVARLLVEHGANFRAKAKNSASYRDYEYDFDSDAMHIGHHSYLNLEEFPEETKTPLHLAALEGQANIATLLIGHGTDVNIKNMDGTTPLHWAAYEGHFEVVEVLIKHGADVNAEEYDEATPLHWAAYAGHAKVAKLLIKRGADVNAERKAHTTPLHLAAWRGRKEVINLLIQHGANLDVENSNGQTALSLAQENDQSEIVPLLERYLGRAPK